MTFWEGCREAVRLGPSLPGWVGFSWMRTAREGSRWRRTPKKKQDCVTVLRGRWVIAWWKWKAVSPKIRLEHIWGWGGAGRATESQCHPLYVPGPACILLGPSNKSITSQVYRGENRFRQMMRFFSQSSDYLVTAPGFKPESVHFSPILVPLRVLQRDLNLILREHVHTWQDIAGLGEWP